ncbi:MAG TPA: hypothetical protein VG722_04955, partial [Tepidisphaeraceae bacterium]|nr:hypothetical protein [Tepidisphaeraceae bacterium]
CLAMYAVAMGLLEAICVIYLRHLGPFRFASSWSHQRIEIIREICTIVMLVTVAWLTGIHARSRISCFLFAFGIWDIFYYLGLMWLAGWPDSLLTWDCLFLIPKPWYGPVLAPMLISAYFVAMCCLQHLWEARGKPLRWSATVLLLQMFAAALWYISFVRDTPNIVAHGYNGITYSWALFLAGALLAVVGLGWAAIGSKPVRA